MVPAGDPCGRGLRVLRSPGPGTRKGTRLVVLPHRHGSRVRSAGPAGRGRRSRLPGWNRSHLRHCAHPRILQNAARTHCGLGDEARRHRLRLRDGPLRFDRAHTVGRRHLERPPDTHLEPQPGTSENLADRLLPGFRSGVVLPPFAQRNHVEPGWDVDPASHAADRRCDRSGHRWTDSNGIRVQPEISNGTGGTKSAASET